MTTYSIPRPVFESLVEALGKARADLLANALEQSIGDMQAQARRDTDALKTEIKVQLKDDLRQELVTRGVFDERMSLVEERFKRLDFKLNIFIAIALIALTFANPTFVELVKHILK